MRTGLVLEGGAMRGMFTAGALDVLMEHNIHFDGIVGVSAGAVFGCNYKSRQPGRAIRYNVRFCRDPRYCSLRSLLKTGDLYGADFCYHQLPESLDVFDLETYRSTPTEFHVVCTDVETGRAVYHQCPKGDGTDLTWMRASASMPLVSRIVEVDGMRLLDGGIADSIPLRYFEQIGYRRNLVILTQPASYVKRKNKLLPIARVCLRQYPGLLEAMATRHETYNATTAYVETRVAAGAALVLRPAAPLPIGRVEHRADRLQATYQLGRTAALEQLDAIQAFLGCRRG